jgi:hypothetical protein
MTKRPKATNHALPSLQKSASIFSAPNPKLRNKFRENSQGDPGFALEIWKFHQTPSIFSRLERLFRLGRRQIVFAGDDLAAGLAFQFDSGAMSNPAAGLCGPFVCGQSHRRLSLRDLTRGKLGQGREDELRLSDLLAGVSYA